MTQAAVAADVHEPLDVQGDVLAKVTLHGLFGCDDAADATNLVLGQIPDLGAEVDLRPSQDAVRLGAPDAENVGERDLDALADGQINT